MKHTYRRALSLLLALLMLGTVLLSAASCGETTEDPVTTQAGTAASTEADTESPYALLDKEDFGRDFVIGSRDDIVEEFEIEALTGDVLDDSIYERNVTVSTDFGVEIIVLDVGDYNAVNEEIKLQVTGGLDDYDTFVGHKFSYNSVVLNNYCYNLASLSSMDLTGIWWDQACVDNLTLDGRTYVLTGDINPQSMVTSSCFVFNKDMMVELNKSVDELNELAENGDWTLDVLYEYGKDVTLDLNGDGKIEYTSDRYNLTAWMMDQPYSMFYGAGGLFLDVVDGAPEIIYTDEDITNIYEKIYNITITQNAYYVTDFNDYSTNYDVFREGRAMFCDVTLGKVADFISETDIAYGILPVPKYDTYQPEYLSFVNGSTPFMMIGKTESDPEFVGTILEAMATYNYGYVTPNLFQVVTKLQAAQDPVSAGMVDVIIRNRIFDLGYYLDYDVTNLVRTHLTSGQAEIASSLKSGRKALERALLRLETSISKCD